MKVIVISLGGSLIVPDKINIVYLDNFRKILRKHYKTHKFVIICGGGAIARKYINALKEEGKSRKEMAEAGIKVTRLNALFLMKLFGKEANDKLPLSMKEVKNNLRKNNIVICGALRYAPDSTSDSTSAKLSNYLKTKFINMTNVKGLYSSDPRENPKASLIKNIDWKSFEKIASRMKYHPGQHFVLDQQASRIIKKHKIKTFIIGPDLKNLEKAINDKAFIGTIIED